MPNCHICQKPLEQNDNRRRPVEYCSNACRQRAYRNRANSELRNAFSLQISADLNENSLVETAMPNQLASVKVPRPPVRYTGGKWRIARWIIDQFPPHECYVEPFAGGASVLFQKPQSRIEAINDLNHDITNFFEVLRTRRDRLIEAITLTPYSEEEYRRAFNTVGITDPVERARLFYVRTRMSFGSSEARQTGFRFQATFSRGKGLVEEWNEVDHLIAAAARLKHVQIASQDYRKILARYDAEKTLFYIDPPYPASTRHEYRDYYRHEMLEDSQHVELAENLLQLKGMAIVSGYDCALYARLFSGWRKIEKPARTNGNFDSVECLWISPNADAARTDAGNLPLFALKPEGAISHA